MMEKKHKDELKIPMYPPLGTPVNPFGPTLVDPMGSYTGVSENRHEIPVQDADDL